ncbi:hypothetical protein R6Q59_009833 [Mikania micrantha]
MATYRELCSILRINPLKEVTCCGHRRDGQRCGNQVSLLSRSQAEQLISECVQDRSTSRRLRDNFKAAAGLLLCKRNHQNQQPEVYARWKQALENYEDSNDSGYDSETPEEQYVQPRRIRGSHRLAPDRAIRSRDTRSESSSVSGSRSALQSAYQTLVTAVLNSDISDDVKAAILRNSSTINNGTGSNNFPDSARNNNAATGGAGGRSLTDDVGALTDGRTNLNRNLISSRSSSTSHRSTAGVSTSSHNTMNGHSSSNIGQQSAHDDISSIVATTGAQFQTTLRTDRVMTTTLTRSNTTSTLNTTVSSTPQSSAPVAPITTASQPTLTPESHSECGVCLEPYTSRNDGHWECHQCRNRVHMNCYLIWANMDPETTRCVYCRAVAQPL